MNFLSKVEARVRVRVRVQFCTSITVERKFRSRKISTVKIRNILNTQELNSVYE